MEWVKLYVHYADDLAIAEADDAGEVMFTRGLAYCGRAKTGGFIPDSKLKDLTRRPARAKTTARQLTRHTSLDEPGPWEVVAGGYQVRNWAHYQEQFDALAARRKSDRDRQAKHRKRKGEPDDIDSRDTSRDTSRDVTGGEKRREEVDAAAAASDSASTASNDLPPAVAILRSALDARKLTARWDTLTVEQLAEIETLIEAHGDTALVKDALRAFQPNKPAVFATAWLGGWRALRAPGALAAVPDQPCPVSGHSGTTRHCLGCASEALATPKENR